jgi:ABC-type Fe3+-hydroxamate transport system substrate-binding protein
VNLNIIALGMRKSAIYGIIAGVAVAAGVGVAFAAMNGNIATETNSQLPPQEADSSNNDVRVIKHEMGETEISGTPERVVVLDNISPNVLFEIGMPPVGVTNLETKRDTNPEIFASWPDAVDVGDPVEPNLEVISQLEPDLIIGMRHIHLELYEQLSNIAPTIIIDILPSEGDGPTMFEALEQNTITIADSLNRRDAGVALLEKMHARIDENAAKLEAAGLAGSTFILADTWTAPDGPMLLLYTPNSNAAEMLQRAGLRNAVPIPEDFPQGESMMGSLEGLSALDGPDAHFLYTTPLLGSNPIETSWKDSPVWNDLTFVKGDRVFHLGVFNLYGGPIELVAFLDKVVEALTATK